MKKFTTMLFLLLSPQLQAGTSQIEKKFSNKNLKREKYSDFNRSVQCKNIPKKTFDKDYFLFSNIGTLIVLPSLGLGGGFYLSEKSMIETGTDIGTIRYQNASLDSIFGSINYKRFLSKKFYIRGGLGYRRISASIWSGEKDKSNLQSIGYSSSVGAQLSLGTHWQWDSLFIDMRWAGVYVPLHTINSKAYQINRNNERKTKQVQGAFDKISKTPNPQFLVLSLGVSI